MYMYMDIAENRTLWDIFLIPRLKNMYSARVSVDEQFCTVM